MSKPQNSFKKIDQYHVPTQSHEEDESLCQDIKCSHDFAVTSAVMVHVA